MKSKCIDSIYFPSTETNQDEQRRSKLLLLGSHLNQSMSISSNMGSINNTAKNSKETFIQKIENLILMFCSFLYFFVKKGCFLLIVVFITLIIIYFMNVMWMVQEFSIPFSANKNLFILTRSCNILISDSFDFKEIKVRSVLKFKFNERYHDDHRTNYIWFDNSLEKPDCQIQIPLVSDGMALNISCSDNCVIRMTNTQEIFTESIYIYSNVLTIKVKDFKVKTFVVSAKELIIQGKDFLPEKSLISANIMYYRMTLYDMNPNYNLGYLPNTLTYSSNTPPIAPRSTTLQNFLINFFIDSSNNYDVMTPALLQISTPSFLTTPIEYICFNVNGTECDDKKHSMVILSNTLGYRLKKIDINNLTDEDFLSNIDFSFFPEFELTLAKTTINTGNNQYFVLTLTNLLTNDLNLFKVIVLKGSILPIAAQNFLQITSASYHSKLDPVDTISLFLTFNDDPFTLQNISIPAKIEFYKKLKDFIITKVEQFSDSKDWSVFNTDTFFIQELKTHDMRIYYSQITTWVNLNTLILFIVCILIAIIFLHLSTLVIHYIKKELRKLKRNDFYLQQVVNEGFLFTSLVEIIELQTQELNIFECLTIPSNWIMLSKVVRQYFNVEYQITEIDFVKHVTDTQPLKSDNRIEFSKIFDAYHNFLINQGVVSFSNNHEELQEALVNLGLDMQSNPNDPELHIIGWKFIKFQRGTLFKDKLFLSMDLNYDSLEYFITHHCKETKKDSDFIVMSEFESAYSIFCKSTSSNKKMFDEIVLKDTFGFNIKRFPKLFAAQGSKTYEDKYISLKIDLIEDILKNHPDAKIIASITNLSSNTNFGRFFFFFLIISYFENFSLYSVMSLTYYFKFMFDEKVIPTALSLANDRFNLNLSFDASKAFTLMVIFIIISPIQLSTLAIFWGYLYNISKNKIKIFRILFSIFLLSTVLLLLFGVISCIFMEMMELIMIFIASFGGRLQLVDFAQISFKIFFSISIYYHSKMEIKKTKGILKNLIDLYFSEALSNHLKNKNKETTLKADKMRHEEEYAESIVNSWVEHNKVSMREFLEDSKSVCKFFDENCQKDMSVNELEVFFSEILEKPKDYPLVKFFINLHMLQNNEVESSVYTNELEKINYLYLLTICEGDEEAVMFFINFYKMYVASQIQDKDLIQNSIINFFKAVIDKEKHFVIDCLIPSFVDICCSELYFDFKKTNISRLKKFLNHFSLDQTTQINEFLIYLPIDYEPRFHTLKRKMTVPKVSLSTFWRPIQKYVDTLTLKKLSDSSQCLDMVLLDILPRNLNFRNWKQLASNFSKICNIDEHLLNFFCDILTTNNSLEVNYIFNGININPYFKIVKRKFGLSAIYLSGAMNISRQNFSAESSASFILSLFKKVEAESIPIQLHFIHLLFNRKPILNKFIKIMKVIEPKMFYFCLTSKTISVYRAYELYSQSNTENKQYLSQITKSNFTKQITITYLEEMKEYIQLENSNLLQFYEILSIFLKIRNFDFDKDIKKIFSISPCLNNLTKEEQIDLDKVIHAIHAIKLKCRNSYLPDGVIDAIHLLSTLQNFEQLSVSDLEKNFGFLVNETINWKIVFKFIRNFYIQKIKQKSLNYSSISMSIVDYFSDHVKSPHMFKQVLVLLKPNLSLTEQKGLTNLQFDETSFWNLKGIPEKSLFSVEMGRRYLTNRIRSLISCLVFSGYVKVAGVIYIHFHLKGLLRRKDISFSASLEKLLAKIMEIDLFLLKALGQFVLPQLSEDPTEFLFPLRELMLSHPLMSRNFQMKEITNSIIRPEFINSVNRIIKGQMKFEELFENEVKDKRLVKALRFLLELKIRKQVHSDNLHQNLNYTLEKYSFDVNEVVDIYNLCKRRETSSLHSFLEGTRKEKIEIVRSFLLAQSKLKLSDSETQKRYLQNNSSIFRVLGLNEHICWAILLAKRGNFKLMRRFLRSHLRDQALNGPFLLDMLEEVLTLTRRSCQLAKKGSCKGDFTSPILQLNPWLEKLLILHTHQSVFVPLAQTIRPQLTVFSYSVFLTLKYYDLNMVDFLFDFQFFSFFAPMIKKFKPEFSSLLNMVKAIESIQVERKELSDLFLELVMTKRLIMSYSKMALLVSPCERELLDSLINPDDDPETSFNTAINNHLFLGWRKRVKDETMLHEIDFFLKSDFSKPLQYYMFDSKVDEIEGLLQNPTYFSSFSKYLTDVFFSTLVDLSRIQPQKLANNSTDQLDFGAPLFISILLAKFAELSLLSRDNFYENYSHVTYKADLLFRFLEKFFFVTSQNLFIRKEDLLKQFLFFFGIMLKPQHSLACSPSMISPSSFIYMFRLAKKIDEKGIDAVQDLPAYLLRLSLPRQFQIKTKLLWRILETDRINSKNGQPLQFFRRFRIGPALQDSERSTLFEYTINLNDRKSLDYSLYMYKVIVDFSLLESFYILNVLVRGRPEKSFYHIFEKLNPTMFNKDLYDFQILNSTILRKKYRGNFDNLLKVFFGLFSTDSKKVFSYNSSYYKISQVSKVFDVVIDDLFEYKETALNLQMIDSGTRSFLDFVRSLQIQTKSWDSSNFLASLKQSKIKFNSDPTVLGVIFEYLLSPGLLRLLIRFI